MTISYVTLSERAGDYPVHSGGGDWNQMVANVNALATRANGQLTRGSGTLLAGTSWKDLFASPASFAMNPTVSLKAIFLLTVNFETAVVSPYYPFYFRIWVNSNSGPDIGYLGYADMRHIGMTGSPLDMYHAFTMQMATLVTLPVDGVNTIKAQYQGSYTDAQTAGIRGAQLVGMEV